MMHNIIVCVIPAVAAFWALAFFVRHSNQTSTFASYPIMGMIGLVLGVASGVILPGTSLWPNAAYQSTGQVHEIEQLNEFQRRTRQSAVPVLVGFLSQHDNRIAQEKATLTLLASQIRGEGQVIQVIGEQSRSITSQIGISDYPTFIVYRRGTEQGRMEGYRDADALREFLNNTY